MGIERLIFSKNICGFSRLKNIFRKGINYQSYEKMIATTSRPIMGNIPNDLLQLILKANPSAKKEAILKAQDAYIDASYLLTSMTKINIQAVNRSRISLDSAVNMLKSDNIALLFTDNKAVIPPQEYFFKAIVREE